MITYDSKRFCQTAKMPALFQGMEKNKSQWMETSSVLARRLFGALIKEGRRSDKAVDRGELKLLYWGREVVADVLEVMGCTV